MPTTQWNLPAVRSTTAKTEVESIESKENLSKLVHSLINVYKQRAAQYYTKRFTAIDQNYYTVPIYLFYINITNGWII